MNTETIVVQAAGFLLAPMLPGIINKTKAAFAGRTGAPVSQLYFDLWRLLRKGAVYSSTTTWVFRAGPAISLAAMVAAMLLVPSGKAGAPISFPGDLLVFAGLLAAARFATVLAALDTGSSFEGMGASREATFSAITEPCLFLALAVLAVISRNLSLSGMAAGIASLDWNGPMAPALAVIAAALFLLLLVENSRIPVDDPNTHLELTMIHEVMVLDHSGPDLAYIEYAASLKLWLFATLLVSMAFPMRPENILVDVAVQLAGVSAVGIAVGTIESIMARRRLVSVPLLMGSAGALGVLGLSLTLALR